MSMERLMIEPEGGHDNFAVIDVETANADLSSICQIGIVHYVNAVESDRWEQLIDPNDYFDEVNTSIHGITEEHVRGAPTFADVFTELGRRLSTGVVVSHTHFDRVALEQAADSCGLSCIQCTWLDSACVVRRTWPDRYARTGYGLANVASDLGISYQAHNAVEDAWAAGQILLRAIRESGLSVGAWLKRVRQPITAPVAGAAYDPNVEGPLYGEIICFTGALQVPRRDAAAWAAAAGCVVADGVTKHTTLLVVGDQDIRKLGGHQISAKHRKAESLIAKGQPLRILSERDFRHITSPLTG